MQRITVLGATGTIGVNTLDVIARQSLFIGVLIEPVNQVEQPLAQHLVFELLSCAHNIQRRDLIVGGDGVEQFAHAS